jgi:hypothetical protein
LFLLFYYINIIPQQGSPLLFPLKKRFMDIKVTNS